MSETVSEQLRRAIERSGMTRYEIAARTGVDQATLSRFVHRKSGLAQDSIDKLCALLGLRLVSERKGKRGKV
jgi:transcriptional regulator with XRE-family HTH domain